VTRVDNVLNLSAIYMRALDTIQLSTPPRKASGRDTSTWRSKYQFRSLTHVGYAPRPFAGLSLYSKLQNDHISRIPRYRTHSELVNLQKLLTSNIVTFDVLISTISGS
jgi:hypothetical protein